MSHGVRGRRPIMADPAAVAALEGQQYVILRPAADVETFYDTEQRIVLERLPAGLSHPAAGHVTLRGFAEPERVDQVLETVRAWATGLSPIEIRVEVIDGFPPPFKVLIARLERSPSLTRAYAALTAAVEAAGLERVGELPLDDWVFHLSLVYCAPLADAGWHTRLSDLRREVPNGPTETIAEAEFVWFADGIEHVQVVPLGEQPAR